MAASATRRVTLRKAVPTDEPFLQRLYASTRAEELAKLPWSPAEREAFLDMQFRAQTASYEVQFPLADFSVVLVDEQPAGRLYVERAVAAIELIDIALLPEFQNAGIGGGLLEDLLDEAQATGRAVRLHVEAANPARRLYQRLGFRAIDDLGVYLLLEWSAAA
jgi:ribosomal protein S18 acetylase RimI-like enzyme